MSCNALYLLLFISRSHFQVFPQHLFYRLHYWAWVVDSVGHVTCFFSDVLFAGIGPHYMITSMQYFRLGSWMTIILGGCHDLETNPCCGASASRLVLRSTHIRHIIFAPTLRSIILVLVSVMQESYHCFWESAAMCSAFPLLGAQSACGTEMTWTFKIHLDLGNVICIPSGDQKCGKL